MDRMDFTQAVARLRVLETRLLNKAKIERMIDSASAEEALKVLQESEYSAFMSNVKHAEDYEILLKEELKRVYALMYEVSPHKQIIDIMSLKYDYHNLKVLLKGKALNKELYYLLMPVGTESIEKLKIYMTTGEFKKLTPIMREALMKAEKAYHEENDPQKIDIILDLYMYKDMLSRAIATKYDFIVNYVKQNIDFINIKTFIRLKKQEKNVKFLKEVLIEGGNIAQEVFIKSFDDSLENFISKLSPYNYSDMLRKSLEDFDKDGKLNILEKLSEDYVMEKAKKAKYITFGPEPLFAYMIAKETEIKIIRIIMVGKVNKISPERIRERLRDIYV